VLEEDSEEGEEKEKEEAVDYEGEEVPTDTSEFRIFSQGKQGFITYRKCGDDTSKREKSDESRFVQHFDGKQNKKAKQEEEVAANKRMGVEGGLKGTIADRWG
jgi:hypothetical protein